MVNRLSETVLEHLECGVEGVIMVDRFDKGAVESNTDLRIYRWEALSLQHEPGSGVFARGNHRA